MKQKMMKSAKAKLLSILTILMVMVCAGSFTALRFMNSKHQEALRNQMLYYVYVDEFADASTYLTTEVRAYAATGNREHYDNYWYEDDMGGYTEEIIVMPATAKEIAAAATNTADADGTKTWTYWIANQQIDIGMMPEEAVARVDDFLAGGHDGTIL